MSNLPEIGREILKAIDFIVPGTLVVIALLFAYGILKWSKRVAVATKEVTSTPWGVIVFIILVIAFFSMWFYLLRPIIKLGG